MPVEALDLFAGLLSQAEAGPTEQFYSRMAAAVCRVAGMRRAVIFAYDDERRLVRAMGAHGIELALFAGASPTAEQVAVARRALAEDTVVEVTGHRARAAGGVPPPARGRADRVHPDRRPAAAGSASSSATAPPSRGR